MNDVFSSMDATAIVPVVKSRKRKPILEAEYGSRSPAKTNVFAESHGSRNSHRSNDSEDLSSDGPLDNGAMSAASSDDEQFSSPKCNNLLCPKIMSPSPSYNCMHGAGGLL